MKKLLISIICILAFACTIHAQDSTDVIHLKNGDVVKGIIIKDVPDEYVKIQLPNGTVLGYMYSEIEKFSKEIRTQQSQEQQQLQQKAADEEEHIEEPDEIIPDRKFYLKGIIGGGLGFEGVSMQFTAGLENSSEDEKVYLYPGGGFNLSANIGYYINQFTFIEASMGFQWASERPEVSNAGCGFIKFPLETTIALQLPSKSSYHAYLGGGAGYYMAPKLWRDLGDYKTEIKYDPSFGFHGLFGINYQPVKTRPFLNYPDKTKPFLSYIEIKIVGGVKYKWKEFIENGSKGTPIPEFQEFSGNQIMFNFGFAYLF